VSGFVEADGCFHVSIQKSETNRNGFVTSLRFSISQLSRDHALMARIKNYFNCGSIVLSKSDSLEFRINRCKDALNKLVPHFTTFILHGGKALEFADFARAAKLMEIKTHLTLEGIQQIRQIKLGMNKARQMSTLSTSQLPLNVRYGWLNIPEYPLIILFILTGAIFLMSSSDLVSMFLAIELQSYGLYIFATLYRDSEFATSAGLTYFLLGGLSSCFILLGSCLLYLNFGITNLDGIYVLSSLSEVNGLESLVETNKYFNLALLVMSVGYLFKVSAAPAV